VCEHKPTIVPHALGQRVIVEVKALKDPAVSAWLLGLDLIGFECVCWRLNRTPTCGRPVQHLLHRLAFNQAFHGAVEHPIQAFIEFNFQLENHRRNGHECWKQSAYIEAIGQ
jgi:hypothetical protein